MRKSHAKRTWANRPFRVPVETNSSLVGVFPHGKKLGSTNSRENPMGVQADHRGDFFKFFSAFSAIDVPAYSHVKIHDEERRLLKGYFNDEITVEEFEALVWKIHEENKKEIFASLGKFDLVMGYFNLADSIGHLSFGISEKMKDVYEELEGLAKEVRNSSEDFVLTISDHGMKALGRFGDHSDNGFYSVNKKLDLGFPKITDFYNLVRRSQNVT